MTKYLCKCVDDPAYFQEFDVSDPKDAAGCFAQWCFDNWAWENSGDHFPMLVNVSGVGVFEVEMEARPVFFARQKSRV